MCITKFKDEISLRVIAGSSRGTKLHCLDGLDVRPTLDRVKEAVFSMLTSYLADSNVLDLFAGSGALGIEALSRGAKSSVFVDLSPISLSVTKKNLMATHLTDKAICVNQDFSSFLQSTKNKFDIVFLDPPYSKGLLNEALKQILKYQVLNSDGLVVCELDNRDEIDDKCLAGYTIFRDKSYGRVRILLLKEL